MTRKNFEYEYSTSYSLEVAWLMDCGIKYNFVKEINGVTYWKFKKSKKLGLALAEFWGAHYH